MWVGRFKLNDDDDIYSPLCIKYNVNFFATPLTNYIKQKNINSIVSGVISGKEINKRKFVYELKKDKRISSIEKYKDFLLIHAKHPASREAKAEIRIFYDSEFIRVKPVLISKDGWEYWEIASLNRIKLNHLIQTAKKYYNGKLYSLKREKIKSITSHELSPTLSANQLEAISVAHKEGYYMYPRSTNITKLARITKKSFSTFQEHLSKAENKLVDFFLKYR